MKSITKEDLEQLVEHLKKLEVGFLPYDVFVEIARLVVLSIIEFVPLRINDNGDIEVLLLSRGSDDPIWPNQLHTPGTVIRPTDHEGNIYVAFKRITEDELGGTGISIPHYVGSNLHKSTRGMEQAQVFWVEVLGKPKVGKFYSADNLPEEFMDSQENFVRQAVEVFSRVKGIK